MRTFENENPSHPLDHEDGRTNPWFPFLTVPSLVPWHQPHPNTRAQLVCARGAPDRLSACCLPRVCPETAAGLWGDTLFHHEREFKANRVMPSCPQNSHLQGLPRWGPASGTRLGLPGPSSGAWSPPFCDRLRGRVPAAEAFPGVTCGFDYEMTA